MIVAQYVIGGILILLSLLLIVAILMQTGKDKSLSGTIAGGSTETFFSKGGGSTKDKWLFRFTVIGSVLFVILAFVLTILSSK